MYLSELVLWISLGIFPEVELLDHKVVLFLIFFKRFYFLEKGKRRERERGRNIDVWLPLTCPLLGTWPTTQA